MLFLRKKPVYLIDENIKVSSLDLIKFNNCFVINSTDIFPNGTKDEVLTAYALKHGYIIVTKDVRMTLRSLIDGVSIIYISDELKVSSWLKVKTRGRSYFPEMFDYIKERFGY